MDPDPHTPIPPNARTPREVLDECDEVLARMQALRIALNPSNRFNVYRSALGKAARGEPVNERHRAQAHLEIAQLTEIGRSLLGAPSSAVIEKLRHVVGDPVLPLASRSQSLGRDTQFELLMAARFVSGGLKVNFEEPDLVVDDAGLFIGIAAKRVKSPARLERRLNEARGQLFRQRERLTHGVIALDITFMVNPTGIVAFSDSLPTGIPVASRLAVSLVKPITDMTRSWAQPQSLLRLTSGVLLFISVIQYVPSEGAVICSSHFRNLILDRDSKHALARLRTAAEPQA